MRRSSARDGVGCRKVLRRTYWSQPLNFLQMSNQLTQGERLRTIWLAKQIFRSAAGDDHGGIRFFPVIQDRRGMNGVARPVRRIAVNLAANPHNEFPRMVLVEDNTPFFENVHVRVTGKSMMQSRVSIAPTVMAKNGCTFALPRFNQSLHRTCAESCASRLARRRLSHLRQVLVVVTKGTHRRNIAI